MNVVSINTVEELNRILRPRGVAIREISHPDGVQIAIDATTFGVEYDDEEVVQFDRSQGELKTCEWHYLNWLLASRGVGVTRVNCTEKDLFSNYIEQYLNKLQFKVYVKGRFVPHWDVQANKEIINRLKASPFVTTKRKSYV